MKILLSLRPFTLQAQPFPKLPRQTPLTTSRGASLQSIFTMSSPISGSLKRKADNFTSASHPEAKKPKSDGSITSFFGAPKSVSTSSKHTSTANAISSPSVQGPKFDKGKWIAKLTSEQKTLLKLEIDTLDESWLAHLKDEIVTPGFLDLKRFLKSEIDAGKKVFPPLEEVYSWLVNV